MPTTDLEMSLTRALPAAVQTNADASSHAFFESEREPGYQRLWDRLIDRTLIEWGSHPEKLSDDDVDPPSAEIIRLAIDWATRCKEVGFPPPDRVVPDANGGIVFQRSENDLSEVFHIWDDRTVEYRRFQGTRLVDRILC